jgi:ATP-binding protein involved in chromosome partitioning
MSEEKPTPEGVEAALRSVFYPGFKRDIVSFGMVKEIALEACVVRVVMSVKTENPEIPRRLESEIKLALKERYPRFAAEVQFEKFQPAPTGPAARPAPGQGESPFRQKAVEGVRHLIAVGSGKGGVGKSTVAVNLAAALSKKGRRVGIMDADVYGPSLPLMMGVSERPTVTDKNKIAPLDAQGMKLMSMGFLVDEDSPIIWRGLMVMKLIDQFLKDVDWGELDYLVIDLPPGTGDTQLTLVQHTMLSGAVIVSTPQDLALVDAVKAAQMFRKVDVPILGLVENMSHYRCPECGHEEAIFGSGGVEREAGRLNIPLIGRIPLNPVIREGGDTGKPVVLAHPDSPEARAFLETAARVEERLASEAGTGARPAAGHVH